MQKPMPNNDELTPFAATDFRGQRRVFGIRRGDRRAHMYIIGRTGMGKSTLLLNLIAHDLRAGNGLALLDPHGDLGRAALKLVPEFRRESLLHFDPLDSPIGLNPLQWGGGSGQRDLTVSGVLAVFKRLWPEFWGPRTEHLLRYALLTLLDWPGATLLEVPRVLTDDPFRKTVLRYVDDPEVRAFWDTEFAGYGKTFRAEATAPILNKVGQFVASPLLRGILGERRDGLDLREVMDGGKILVADLAKGRLGEDACALLGALLLTGFELAALGRAGIAEQERRDFYLYVDEFHTFVTLTFAEILPMARKYRLNLILAHQYLEQLDERILAAVLGNVGTLIAFRLGVRDAAVMAQEFFPVFSKEDLINLPQHSIYIKLMSRGVAARPFSAVTLPPPQSPRFTSAGP